MHSRFAKYFSMSLFIAATSTGCVANDAANSDEANVTETSPAQSIANLVKSKLTGWTVEQGQQMMRAHLQRLRLINANGDWATPELSAVSSQLLPTTIGLTEVNAFVDQMAMAADQNDYLATFLSQANQTHFNTLASKFAAEGEVVLPDAVAYGLVLENLTQAMRNDWRLMQVCKTIWQQARKDTNALQYEDAFHIAKLVSIEIPISNFISYHQANSVPTDFGSKLLPLNISEAVIVDLKAGYKNNARAGWNLLVNRPGASTTSATTGAGPSQFSTDGKAINISPPLPLHWADLYSTWNLAFVTQYPHFPWVVTKLLIPSVGNYHDKASEYLYNRVLALYVHLNWLVLMQADDAIAKTTSLPMSVGWNDPDLRKLWGTVNMASGSKFAQELLAADPSFKNWITAKTSEFNGL